MRWEYNHIRVVADSFYHIDEILSSKGLKGWELVSVVQAYHDREGLLLFFKRGIHD